MDDQKIENLLNLALDANSKEREKSQNLNIGYDPLFGRWEVIVRYNELFEIQGKENWGIVYLSGGYAIVTLPQQDLEYLAQMEQVEYIEKPKRLYFGVDAGRTVSCINPVQSGGLADNGETGLLGKGVLVAVIDSGVDYFHPDFRNADGSSRIRFLWDQSAVGISPENFTMGVEYSKEDLDRALAAGEREEGLMIVPEQDFSGHGTEVLGIAAGNGRASGGRFRGVAPFSDLIIVKLGVPERNGFPRTTELMQALEYVYQKAAELGMPMAVNISFGTVYGSHRGNSLLETYMDMMAAKGRSVIITGIGNEGNAGGHASGRLAEGERKEVELLISDFETSLTLQIWKNYVDVFRISVIQPDGSVTGPFGQEIGASRYLLGRTELLVYYGEPSPYQAEQEIYIDFIPADTYIDSGVWRILLEPVQIVTGEYEMWLSDLRARNQGTRFLQPDAEVTMTIPAAASQVIAVGAYDSRRNAYASFSGRGWPDTTYGVRPDLAAPGVEITTTAVGGNYVRVTGTSFATPFVTGSAALMMEYGIVRRNDPYLYGEKVRAYLRKGARQLPGYEKWPNNQVGYGILCLRDSLPE